MPSENRTLHDELAEWLSKQGYPLEMEVAHRFRAAGFDVAQSTYYADPETGDAREIDIFAADSKRISEFDVRLTCLVECKVSTGKPWVIFTSDRELGEERFDFFSQVASDLGARALMQLYTQNYFPLPLALAYRDRVGYGATLGLRKNQEKVDVAYQAVMQAAKAAIARGRLIDSLVQTELTPEPIIEVVLPVVLIDAPLFEYYLENDLTKTLRTFHWGLLSFGNPVGGRSEPTLVQVVTKQGLVEFVSAIKALSLHLQSVVSENVDDLRKHWKSILRSAGKDTVTVRIKRGE
jgi:hypothetical protein